MTVETLDYELLPSFPQDSPEWHEARRHGIGASDVAAVLGLSEWQTPLDVYRQKMGVPHRIPKNLAYFGHKLESVIADWVSDEYPEIGTVEPGFAARSLAWPWLTATPDRMVNGRPLEIKTASAFTKATWRDGVPLYYQAQVQCQLAVLGADAGWLAVLHGGNEPDLFPVERDDEFIRQVLVPRTREFWEQHVLAQVPPDPLNSVEAAELWPGDENISVEGTEDLFDLWSEYGRMQAEVVETNQALDRIKLELQKAMRDATQLTYQGKVLFTWKPRRGSQRFDLEQFRRDAPKLAAQYMKQGAPTRVFVRKTVKEVEE